LQTFKYRLQPLLDLKIDLKAQLQASVEQSQRTLAAELEELAKLQQAERQLEEKLFEARRTMFGGANSASGFAIQQYRDYLSGLAIDLETARNSTFSQQLQVSESEAKLAEAKRKLTEGLQEIDVLTRHRDRLQQRFLKAAENKEAAVQDEIGAAMFVRQGTLHEGR
jgi:flagellar biosynthesis chaperone FliJ